MKKLKILLLIMSSMFFINVALADILPPPEDTCIFSVKNVDFNIDKCYKECDKPGTVFYICTKFCDKKKEKCIFKRKDLNKIYIGIFILLISLFFIIKMIINKVGTKKFIYILGLIFILLSWLYTGFLAFLSLILVYIFLKMLITFLFRGNKRLGLDRIDNKSFLLNSLFIYILGGGIIRVIILIVDGIGLIANEAGIVLIFSIMFLLLIENFLFYKLLDLKYKKSLLLTLLLNSIFASIIIVIGYLLSVID